MSGAFDPYHVWLGIPPKDQPPNHYRLLGLELFEDNPDVIDAAANRQTSYLRGMAAGEHRRESQAILNEIAAARRCLLDAAKKSHYDAGLNAKQQASTPAATAIPAEPAGFDFSINTDDDRPVGGIAVDTGAARVSIPAASTRSTAASSRTTAKKQPKPLWHQPIFHIVMGVLILILAITLYLQSQPAEKDRVREEDVLSDEGDFFETSSTAPGSQAPAAAATASTTPNEPGAETAEPQLGFNSFYSSSATGGAGKSGK
ncbi:MAG: hypothetical protein R3B90_02015 [Planctomycetaceae bacterium]